MLKRVSPFDETNDTIESIRREEPRVVPVDPYDFPVPMNESPSRSPASSESSHTKVVDVATDNQSCLPTQCVSNDVTEHDRRKKRKVIPVYRKARFRIPVFRLGEEMQIGNTCIGIRDMKTAGKKFFDAIKSYICTENAFPPVSEFDSAYIDICKRLVSIPQEKEITITDTLRDKFHMAMMSFRVRLYKRFKHVLESYTFEASALPEQCKNNRKRQFKYMMDAVRFARKDYLSSGAILQSPALGDIIYQVFYTEKGLELVLQPDESVSRATISLTFVYMYINMEQMYGNKVDHVEGARMGVLRASIYHSTLNGVYENGEKVDWEQVQRVQTEHVRHHLNTGPKSGAYTLVPLSSTYQPKYQDGVYVSDSDEQ